MPRQKPEPDPRLDTLVRYYHGGWRYGYLDEVKGNQAWIRPVRAYDAAQPRRVHIALTDIAADTLE